MATTDALRSSLLASGQSHLWAHYESLPTSEAKSAFEVSLREAGDFSLLSGIFKESMRALDEGVAGDILPPSSADLTSITSLDESVAVVGYERTAAGEVAVLILAGGSGTRLGQTIPKGMFICPELAQQKSLFQLQCEKIRKLELLASSKVNGNKKVRIPLLYMTSEQTDLLTREFFEENGYFGLQKEQIHFFMQSSIPSMDMDGNILLKNDTELCMFPGGNAGVYSALDTSGVLGTIERLGVKYVQVFTVDNILCKLGDPTFTGYAHIHQYDVVVKACPKARDHEAVGVFAKRGGKWGVVEYTEIGKERAEARNAAGDRLFDAANIAIYLYSLDFLKQTAERMRTYTYYHVAKKPIPTKDGPVAGVKLEAFIFDLFEYATKFSILSVNRSDEFSGIKNSDDEANQKADTPFTAVRDLRALHWTWVQRANEVHKVAGISGLTPSAVSVEFSPLVSFAGEGIDAPLLTQIASEAIDKAVVSIEAPIVSSL